MRTFVMLLAVAACGCNGSSSGGNTPCTTTANALCEQAATCTANVPDGGVRFLLGDDGGNGDISFDSVGGCELLYAIGCGEAEAGAQSAFVNGCTPSTISGAQCGTSSFGAGLLIPPACNNL